MRIITLLVAFMSILISTNASAQNRVKIMDGLYLVSYGNTAVIEDEKNQRSISVEVTQEIKNAETSEMMYKVVCGEWTKRVVKYGLNAAISAGVKAAGLSSGATLIVSASATLAGYIYDDVCDYYGEKYK